MGSASRPLCGHRGLTPHQAIVPPGHDGKFIVCAAAVDRSILVGEPRWIAFFPPEFILKSRGDDPQAGDVEVNIRRFSRPVLNFRIKPRAKAPRFRSMSATSSQRAQPRSSARLVQDHPRPACRGDRQRAVNRAPHGGGNSSTDDADARDEGHRYAGCGLGRLQRRPAFQHAEHHDRTANFPDGSGRRRRRCRPLYRALQQYRSQTDVTTPISSTIPAKAWIIFW